MAKTRTHSLEFKRQVAQKFLAGETLHSLAKRYDLSRNLIRIWVQRFEAGALDEDSVAADLIEQYKGADRRPRTPASGKRALELEFMQGAHEKAPRQKSAGPHIRDCRPAGLSVAEGCRLMGNRPFDLLRRRACADRRHRNRRSDRGHLRGV